MAERDHHRGGKRGDRCEDKPADPFEAVLEAAAGAHVVAGAVGLGFGGGDGRVGNRRDGAILGAAPGGALPSRGADDPVRAAVRTT